MLPNRPRARRPLIRTRQKGLTTFIIIAIAIGVGLAIVGAAIAGGVFLVTRMRSRTSDNIEMRTYPPTASPTAADPAAAAPTTAPEIPFTDPPAILPLGAADGIPAPYVPAAAPNGQYYYGAPPLYQYYPQSGPAQMPPVFGYAQPPPVVVASMDADADLPVVEFRDDAPPHPPEFAAAPPFEQLPDVVALWTQLNVMQWASSRY